MSDHDQLQKAKHDVLAENTAQAVYKHLRKLYEEEARFRSRWIWELLQNARDAALQTGVNIWLVREADRVILRHDGAAFTGQNIAHLVYHGTTKYDSPDDGPIGRFGTGFLTTHLISRTVSVAGFLGERRFRFMLDRRGETATEIQEAMESSWKQFEQSQEAGTAKWNEDFTTEFDYPVQGDIVRVIDDGIADLLANAAYLLAFNDKIASIRVCQPGQTLTFTKRGSEPIGENAQRIRIEEAVTGRGSAARYVVAVREGDTSVATEVRAADAGWALAERGKTPRIFVAFPLTSTTDFLLPVVVNDERFQPREDRDTLFLQGNRDGPHPNMQRMATACSLAFRLAVIAAEQGWRGAAALARLTEIRSWDWVDLSWLRKTLWDRFVTPLRQAPVMMSAAATRIAPRAGTIPLAAGPVTCVELWDLVERIPELGKALPLRAEAQAWAENLASWEPVLGQPVHQMEECLTLTRVCEWVDKCESLSNAKLVVTGDAVPWLNSLYALINKAADYSEHFGKYRLIPSQTGALRKLNELRRDDGIDEGLKDLAERLGFSARASLLDQRVSFAQVDGLQRCTEAELLTTVLQKLKEKAKASPLDAGLGQAAVECFRWMVSRGHMEKLEDLPVLTRTSTPEGLPFTPLRRGSPESEHLLLAPIGCWPVAARAVADLFPKKTLADEYHSAIPDAALWAEVSGAGLLRLEPLYKKPCRDLPFLPDEPLPGPEKDKKFKHRTKEPVEVSALAFFGEEGTGLRAVSGKQRAIDLLRFLADHVLSSHSFALEPIDVECECEQRHRCYPCDWLSPMAENRWVPIGDHKRSAASAESIAQLFEKREEELRHLTRGDGRKLLKSLGISLADLGLRAVAKDEDTRIELIDSLAGIFSGMEHDPANVRLLAEELKHSPRLLKDLQDQRERREKVHRNQDLGAKVEQLLQEALRSHGLNVERTGVGSDCEVENDVVEDNQEMLLELKGERRSLLVEIKGTLSNVVRMTERQAEKAVSEAERFTLCIVRLDDSEVTIDAVRERCRFVFDIGAQVAPVWKEYSRYRKSKAEACTRMGDVELVVNDGEVRFAVGQGAWDAGVPLDRAVKQMRAYLSDLPAER